MGKKQDQLNIDILKRTIKKGAKGPLSDDELLGIFYKTGYKNGQLRTRAEFKQAFIKKREEQK